MRIASVIFFGLIAMICGFVAGDGNQAGNELVGVDGGKDIGYYLQYLTRNIREAFASDSKENNKKRTKETGKKKVRSKKNKNNQKLNGRKTGGKGNKKKNRGNNGKRVGKNNVGNNRQACLPTSCLNTMVSVLTYYQTTATNMIKIAKRVASRSRLFSSKQAKSDAYENTVSIMVEALGTKVSFDRNNTYCAGNFNTTQSIQATGLAYDLLSCNSTIFQDCTYANSIDPVATCQAGFETFLQDVEGTSVQDCSGWSALDARTSQYKSCIQTVKDMDAEIKERLPLCKGSFGGCKNFEIDSAEFVGSCRTSNTSAKATLSGLLSAQANLDLALKSIDDVLANAKTGFIQKRELEVTPAVYITAVLNYTQLLSGASVDNIASDLAINEVAQRIILFVVVGTISADQLNQLESSKISLNEVKSIVGARISQLLTILNVQTSVTGIPDDIVVSTLRPKTTTSTATATVSTTSVKTWTVNLPVALSDPGVKGSVLLQHMHLVS